MQRFIFITGGVLLVVFLAAYGWYQYRHNLGFVCSSSMAVFDDKEHNTNILNFSQSLSFYKNGNAFSNLSGEVIHNGKPYVVNRTISFSYSRIGKLEYQTEVVSAVKTGKDNVPHELDRLYLASLLTGTKRIIHVNEMPNRDLVFAFSSGPYLICARH